VSSYQPRILVVDDERVQRGILKEILESRDHRVEIAGGLEEALSLFNGALEDADPFDLVFTDLKMPGATEGLDLLREVKEACPGTEVVLMTAYAEVQTAVQAMRFGAFEYLPKPFDRDRFLRVVDAASEKLGLLHENRRLRALLDQGAAPRRMIGRAPRMLELLEMISRVAVTDTTCLIRGESGTGKELVARAVHEGGGRATEPFIAINCAAIPETLIESELFGHEKGVFTGAHAAKAGRFEEVGRGTLFLDEIGSMKYDLQAKLLRVIQEREFSRVGSSRLTPFHGRIVAATAQDLESLISRAEFREDLYFRLNVVTLEIPPLRERRDDIPLLVQHFLHKGGDRLGRSFKGVTLSVLEAFEAHDWPGNVRELENCLERMMVLGDGELLDVPLLPPTVRGGRSEVSERGPAPGTSPAPESRPRGEGSGGRRIELPPEGVVLEELEAELIEQALDRSRGKLEPAAQLLGITYKTLQYRIKKYGLNQRAGSVEPAAPETDHAD